MKFWSNYNVLDSTLVLSLDSPTLKPTDLKFGIENHMYP